MEGWCKGNYEVYGSSHEKQNCRKQRWLAHSFRHGLYEVLRYYVK